MKKLFIVNSRADSIALDRFKKEYSKYSEEFPGDSRVIYTEFAGHASEALNGKRRGGRTGWENEGL